MDLLQAIVLAGTIVIGVFAVKSDLAGERAELNCDYIVEHPHGTVPPSDKCQKKKDEQNY